MADYSQQIKELEEQITKTKYNKKTEFAIGKYKAKLAQLKIKQEERRGIGSGGGTGTGWEVKRSGDGTVILLGFPSAGKSTLLNALTGAESQVAAYAFTTLTCIPGMMEYKHAKIQILDVPGIVQGAASGKGRGKEVLASMRSADFCLILLDATRPREYDVIVKEIYDTHIRLNQKKPDVKITKTGKDGIRFGATVPLTHVTDEIATSILKEFRINNAEVVLREDITVDQLIDCIEGNKKYMPAITVVNKMDLVSEEELEKIMKKYHGDIAISAKNNIGMEELKEIIYTKLDLINIFLKEPTKPADMDVPLIMFKDCTIKNVCDKLHKDFARKFKFARVWGTSAKFGGQKVMMKHILSDGDILEVHLK
jgi:uncharacterized protein